MKTIYIEQGTPNSCNAGTVKNPYRVPTGNAKNFDAIFKFHRGPTTFILGPGIYDTQGCWSYSGYDWAMVGPNSSIIGTAGSVDTVIRLAADYTNDVNGVPAQYIETIIGGGGLSSGSEQMRFSGFKVDCYNARLPVIGLHAFSSGCIVNDVVVNDINGVWGAMEGFGILVNDGLNSKGGGSSIINCKVTILPGAKSYCTGIYMGSLAQLRAPNAIRDCISGAIVTTGVTRAHAAFAANENTTISNCVGNGFERFLFGDTGNIGDIDVINCRGEFGSVAIDLPAPNGNGIEYRRRIRIANSSFGNTTPSANYAALIAIQDGPAPGVTHNTVDIQDIDIDNVRVSSFFNTAGAPTGQGFFTVSIGGTKVQRIWVRNSTLPVGAKTLTPGPSGETGGTLPEWGTPQGSFFFENLKSMAIAGA